MQGVGQLLLGGSRLGQAGLGRVPLIDIMLNEQQAQLGGQLAVATGQAGLAFQRAQAWLELGQHILAALEVSLSLAQLALGVVLTRLEHANLGGILEQAAALLGAQRERGVDQALIDDRIRAAERADGLLQIAQAHAATVDEILIIAGAGSAASERHLAVGQRQQPVAVIDRQRHLGQAGGGTAAAAAEQEILSALGAQRGVALLAEHPAHSVGDIALAGAIRADDGGDAGAELKDRARGKGFEALDFEAFEVHVDAI